MRLDSQGVLELNSRTASYSSSLTLPNLNIQRPTHRGAHISGIKQAATPSTGL